jgi:phosphotransferase system  glucose/maltose/N-acetylglucosamine-specific IIC component
LGKCALIGKFGQYLEFKIALKYCQSTHFGKLIHENQMLNYIIYLLLKIVFYNMFRIFIRLQVMKENRKINQDEKSDTKNNLAKNGLSDCFAKLMLNSL